MLWLCLHFPDLSLDVFTRGAAHANRSNNPSKDAADEGIHTTSNPAPGDNGKHAHDNSQMERHSDNRLSGDRGFGSRDFANKDPHGNTRGMGRRNGKAPQAPQADIEDAPAQPSVVVVEQNRVVNLNAGARRAGVLPGCTLATAHSIITGLRHFTRNLALEDEQLDRLAGACYRFSSLVCLDSPNCVLLEVGRSARIWGSAQHIAALAEARCRALGSIGQVGIEATPLGARALALAPEARTLAEVPVARLSLPVAANDTFESMGIRTLGKLLSLPATELAQRFGTALSHYLERLCGLRSDPREALMPAERFRSTLHLLEPVRGKDELTPWLTRLAEELSQWLTVRRFGADELIWRFESHGRGAHNERELCVRFAEPVQATSRFLAITLMQIERTELPQDILDIRLTCTRPVRWEDQVTQLFAHLSTDHAGSRPSELLEQLSARLDASQCQHIHLADDHRPEHAWLHQAPLSASKAPHTGLSWRAATRSAARASLADGNDKRQHRPHRATTDIADDGKDTRMSAATAAVGAAMPRPLWLLDPPRPIARHHLQLISGPERVQTGWWERMVHRDYYVARLADGSQCWAFVGPRERWYLHGYFA